MNVLLVTTWDTHCGIAEHSAMLKEAVEKADADIDVIPEAEALDPFHDSIRSLIFDCTVSGVDLVHLNYHAALHSRWTPARIQDLQEVGYKVLVTYHDTGVPNVEQCKTVVMAADAAVVHEPFDDLPAEKTHYWRMGVPAAPEPYPPRADERPLVATVGFPLPWKCYDALCEAARAAGWGTYLIAPGATPEQVQAWQARGAVVETRFLPRDRVVQLLACCDATAFTYVCHNPGQSGALLLGIAARKPVLALSTCRQFRALYDDPLGRSSIRWCETFDDITATLRTLPREGRDPGIVALAEQESWTTLGKRYAELYRRLCDGGA